MPSVIARLDPSSRDAQWWLLHAEFDEDEKPVEVHFHASSEDDALAYAGNVLAARWPDKQIDITISVKQAS